MKYILTEEEYNSIINKNKQQKKCNQDKEKLQEFCTFVANNMPVVWNDEMTPATWGCIRVVKIGYCDHCPSVEVCPYENKQFSK